MLVDVHAHLSDERMMGAIDAVIARARERDVRTIITNGLGPEDNHAQLELAKKFDIVKAALGFYPPESYSRDVNATKAFILENQKAALAIGEIGLDRKDSPDNSMWNKQLKAFKVMLETADEIGRPVIIHSRKAEKEVLDALKSFGGKVVLHCFGGKMKLAKQALDSDYYFSIPPSIIRSTHFQELVKICDSSHLLTETDSPYQGPGHDMNEPANVSFALDKISEILGLDRKEVEHIIYANFQKIF